MTRAIWLLPGDARLTDEEALPRERRRFTSAMLVSALGHALLLALLIGLWAPAPEETARPIPITLRAGDGASGAAGGGTSTIAASAASAASENPSPPQIAEAQTPPAETTAPQQTETPTAAPPTLAQAVELSPPVAETAEPVPPRKPTPPHAAQATAPAQPPPQPAQAMASGSPSTATPSSDAVTREGVGGRGRGDEGAGRAAIGDGSLEGPGDDYLSKLQSWIKRFRHYPDEAVAKKQEGTVSIGFKLARDGTVLDAWIAQSSGYPLLDDAALKMIHAASPVPKVPNSYQGETLTLKAMPARFSIGVFDRLFH